MRDEIALLRSAVDAKGKAIGAKAKTFPELLDQLKDFWLGIPADDMSRTLHANNVELIQDARHLVAVVPAKGAAAPNKLDEVLS